MTSFPLTSDASNYTPPTHTAAAAEANTMTSAPEAANTPLSFRETRHGKITLKKLAHLKNRNLNVDKEESYMNRLATFLFIPSIREGVKNAKKGASDEDVLKEIYKHIAASQQFKDSMSEGAVFITVAAVNTEATDNIEDIQTHTVSGHIYAPEDCPTPARHPDEPTTEPEELELSSPIIEIVKTVADKQPSPSWILVTKSLRVELTSEAPFTPMREERGGSPDSKFPVLKSSAKTLSEKSKPIEDAQTAETVDQKEATAKEESVAMPHEPLKDTTNMAGNGRRYVLQNRITEGTGVAESVAKKKKATEKNQDAMNIFQIIDSSKNQETFTSKKLAVGSNKRKREDNSDSTSRAPANSTASKRTTAVEGEVTKKPAFVAGESESEDEQPLQKRKKVNCKKFMKPKEDELSGKKDKKAPKLNNKGPVITEIKSNDFLKAHAHLSFEDKIAAALTYNNSHTGFRPDSAPPQQDKKKRKRSQDNGDGENEFTPVYKKLNTEGKAPALEKKNQQEFRSDAQLRALARKNNPIKSILEDIEKSLK